MQIRKVCIKSAWYYHGKAGIKSKKYHNYEHLKFYVGHTMIRRKYEKSGKSIIFIVVYIYINTHTQCLDTDRSIDMYRNT